MWVLVRNALWLVAIFVHSTDGGVNDEVLLNKFNCCLVNSVIWRGYELNLIVTKMILRNVVVFPKLRFPMKINMAKP